MYYIIHLTQSSAFIKSIHHIKVGLKYFLYLFNFNKFLGVILYMVRQIGLSDILSIPRPIFYSLRLFLRFIFFDVLLLDIFVFVCYKNILPIQFCYVFLCIVGMLPVFFKIYILESVPILFTFFFYFFPKNIVCSI